jgi:hypothetical protein
LWLIGADVFQIPQLHKHFNVGCNPCVKHPKAQVDTMWNEIKDETDIQNLKTLFGGFHDSCLRDVYISTSNYVDEKLAMNLENKTSASLLFQRQFKPDTVLELKFYDVQQFHYEVVPDNYNAVIYDATLKIQDGLFYWADDEEWELDENDGVWISGKKLFWRMRPDLIGEVNRLGENH